MYIDGHRTGVYVLFLVLFFAVILQGCGLSKEDCTAPNGSTITINPASQTWTFSSGSGGLGGDLEDNWSVKVSYSDGTPMPYACIRVWGALAVPSGYGAYQFQYYPAPKNPNAPVDAGFTAQTDEFGMYNFSTLISAGTGTFKDTIRVQSGAISASATYEVTSN